MAAALGCIAPLAGATQLIRPFEVVVPGGESNTTFQAGLRTALVRATGRRGADADPAFEPLLADARRYVQLFRPAAGGLQVVYDGAALERAIVAAGGRLWPNERPVVLVVLADLPAGADLSAVRAQVDTAAMQRGLPVVLVPAETAALGGPEPAPDSALAAARRFEADAVLVGRGTDVAGSALRWSLITPASVESFSGSTSDGLQGAADALASTARDLMAQPELETWVEISGVRSLRDYALAQRLLAGALGVDSVLLIESSGAGAVFRVVARGGSQALAAALANQSRLRPLATDGRRLGYEFVPD